MPPASPLTGVAAILNPASVAIVGATPRVDALGGRPIVNLRRQGFAGAIYPVNPRYEAVLDLPCYASLAQTPTVPDLALILVGQDRVFAALDEALAAGVKAAIVYGGGFAELGGEGVARQDRLAAYGAQGLRICGPNCNGVFSIVNKTALGFAPSFEMAARSGPIALITQSGNVNTCIASRGFDMGVGFSHLIASGNEADLEMADYVEYLQDDPATQVFALFVEGFRNPARFLAVAERALRAGKPIVLMKMGRTASSEKVAMSHTGSMTGSYDVLVGALRQKGVIVVDDIDRLCSMAAVLATGIRPGKGGVAVASLSGGMAGIIADTCHEHGVHLTELTDRSRTALAAKLPGVANLDNPLDMTGQVVNEPDCWRDCIDILAHDPGVDVLLSVLSITANQSERRFAQDIVDLRSRVPLLPLVIWPSGQPAGCGFEILRDAGLVVLPRVEDAVRAIAAWRHYWQSRDGRIAALETLPAAPTRTGDSRASPSGWSLLEEAGIPIARQTLVGRREEVVPALMGLRLPVGLKIESDALAHKTEIGALRLQLRTQAEVLAAYDQLSDIAALHLGTGSRYAMLIQEMHPGKRELILGLKRETDAGIAVVVGIGGIFSETHRDIAIRLAPLTPFDAEEMLGELRARSILGDVRGMGEVSRPLLVDILLRLSDLATRHAERIEELDINPLILRDDGQAACAVDVLVKYRRGNLAPVFRTPEGGH